MATKSKKKAKIEIENNEDLQDKAVKVMPEEEEAPEVKIEDLPGVGPATCLLYTSPSPRDRSLPRMPSSA